LKPVCCTTEMAAAIENEIILHQGFGNNHDAFEVIERYLTSIYNPMRRETNETVRNFNKKCRKSERHITDLAEEDQYSQR